MTNLVCESRNKSWVTFETCRLRALQRNKTTATIFATFLHPANSISLRMQVQKKFNGYKPWVIDVTLDACKFMRSPKTNKVAKMIWDLFKNFSTVNHTCPYAVSIQTNNNFKLFYLLISIFRANSMLMVFIQTPKIFHLFFQVETIYCLWHGAFIKEYNL